MEIKDYENLKKKLCSHLEEIATHKTFDKGDIDVIDTLVHSIEKIQKIIENEDMGYSMNGGMWNAEGSYGRNSYGRGGYGNGYGNSYGDDSMGDSYAGRGGMHYVRGHYSHADGIESDIRRMMEDRGMSSSDKMTLEKALEIIRR